jgi:transmembrane sensor
LNFGKLYKPKWNYMIQSRIDHLLNLYLNGSIGQKDMDELRHIIGNEENADFFLQKIETRLQSESLVNISETGINADVLFEKIMSKAISINKVNKITPIRKMPFVRNLAVAAGVAMVMGLFWILKVNNPEKNIGSNHVAESTEGLNVLPGSNKATLTLADGKVILLDSNTSKNISSQGVSAVSVSKEGELIYQIAKRDAKADDVINILSIPKGGQYKLQLADGTMIWMNAASTLRYPASFQGSVREVELTGEAYFEVAHDKEKPFIVKLKNETRVQVLGTSFNINAYDNENELLTTLLEGSVKVITPIGQQALIPGQQLQIDQSGKIRVATNINTEEVIAWKNGQFSFHGADLRTLMRQLERWYDIEIEYKGNFPKDRFSGTVSRTANLSQVLKILELSEVHFKMEGKKLIVMPDVTNK